MANFHLDQRTSQVALLAGNHTINQTVYSSNSTLKSWQSLHSEGEFAGVIELHQPYNILVLIIGILGIVCNSISFVAIYNIKGGINARYRALLSLACADSFVCITVIGHIIVNVYKPNPTMEEISYEERLAYQCNIENFKALNNAALMVTLFNLLWMALDHYIAILKPFQYQRCMSKRRSTIAIVCFWIISLILGYSDLMTAWMVTEDKGESNYCDKVWTSEHNEEYIVFVLAFLICGGIIYIYVRVYLEVRRMQNQGPPGQEVYRNKKALCTTLLIIIAFCVCWLPVFMLNITMIIIIKIDYTVLLYVDGAAIYTAEHYLWVLTIFNTVLDPIIYAIRIRDVQRSYVNIACKVAGYWCKQVQNEAHSSMIRRQSHSYTMTGHSMMGRKQSRSMSIETSASVLTRQLRSPSFQTTSLCLPEASELTPMPTHPV